MTDPRVGYLLSHYPSANHTYLLREVRALRAAGLPVSVAAIDGDTRPIAALTPEEVEERAATFVVKRAGVGAIAAAHLATLLTSPIRYAAGLATAAHLAGADLGRLARHIVYFAEAVVAGRHLVRAGCTHVHTHYATTVTMIAARTFRFDWSGSIHGSAEFIEPRAQRLREKVADAIFVRAISMYGRSQLMLASQPTQWSKIKMVRLGVDPDDFRTRGGEPHPARFRVTTVGQLQPAKGFPVLLAALALAVNRGCDVGLTIVGDGGERASLEAQAVRLGVSDRVEFLGALNQAEVRGVLARSDAFALASFAEGIPVVLMEAMASGLPCVATRITGIPELIDDGVSGLLVTPADETALADAIVRVATDAGLRARLGGTGRDQVTALYNLDRNVNQLVSLFAELGSRASRRVDVAPHAAASVPSGSSPGSDDDMVLHGAALRDE